MRPSLLNPRGQRRRSRERHERGWQAPSPSASPPAPALPPDLDLRVREAGGLDDRASYACQCGYLFRAAVCTTVACPHCGAEQAW